MYKLYKDGVDTIINNIDESIVKYYSHYVCTSV